MFFYAPNDADQGFIQKIFYLHVPLAIVALCGFVAGGVYGIRYLRYGDRAHDLRSYVAIHISLILGIAALITGSIWAKAAWGHWWVWEEPTLVSFLIVFLLYACYQPLRFSIEDPERQARNAAVFAIVGGRLRAAQLHRRPDGRVVHPPARAERHRRLDARRDAAHLPGLAAGMAVLFVTLCKYELTSKQASMRLRALKRRLADDDDAWLPTRRSAAPQQL